MATESDSLLSARAVLAVLATLLVAGYAVLIAHQVELLLAFGAWAVVLYLVWRFVRAAERIAAALERRADAADRRAAAAERGR